MATAGGGGSNGNAAFVAGGHASLLSHDREVDMILHDLKVFASLKENERISTRMGVYVNKASDKLAGLKRLYSGENRSNNLAFIETRFNDAFAKIDYYLTEREKSMSQCDPTNMSRTQVLNRIVNIQIVNRLRDSVESTKAKIARVFRTTYEEDPTALSRLERICEDIDDRLKQVDVSLRFLEAREKEKGPTMLS